MKKRRIVVFALGITFLLLFGSMATSIFEFFSANDVNRWDGKLISYLVLVILGSILTITSLISNRFFGKHIYLVGVIVVVFLGAKAVPAHLSSYRKLLYPISYSQLNRLTQLNFDKYDEEVVYLYRSDCPDCINFKPKLNDYLRNSDNSISEFDLTTIRNKMEQREYSKFTKKLGVYAVPALIYFSGKGNHSHEKPFSVTFNALNDSRVFGKAKEFLAMDITVKNGNGLVVRDGDK